MDAKKVAITTLIDGFVGSLVILIAIVFHYFIIGEPNTLGWVIIPLTALVTCLASFKSKVSKFITGLLTGILIFLLIFLVSYSLMTLSGSEQAFYTHTQNRDLITYISYIASAAANYNWFPIFIPIYFILTIFGALFGNLLGNQK